MTSLVKGYTNIQCTHTHDACVCVCILIKEEIEEIFEMWVLEMIYYLAKPNPMKVNLH